MSPAGYGSAFPAKSSQEILEEVVVGRQKFRWIKQNFVAQFVQLLKHWLCDMWLSVVVEKNWALSADQCRLRALTFSAHLINLLSSFTGIQKAAVDQTVSRPPNSDHDHFLVQVCLWEVLRNFSVQPLGWLSPVVISNPLFVTHHNLIEKWSIIVA